MNRSNHLVEMSVWCGRFMTMPSLTVACLLFLGALMLTTSVADAAGFGMMRKSPEEIVANMKDRLLLSTQQQSQVLPIIAGFVRQRDELLDRRSEFGRGNRKALKDQFLGIKRETDRQLAQVLTDSQMQAYLKMQEEARENWRTERARGRGFGSHKGDGA